MVLCSELRLSSVWWDRFRAGPRKVEMLRLSGVGGERPRSVGMDTLPARREWGVMLDVRSKAEFGGQLLLGACKVG